MAEGNGSYGQALGMIETKGWVALVEATDAMTKAANVEVVKPIPTGGGGATRTAVGELGARAGSRGRRHVLEHSPDRRGVRHHGRARRRRRREGGRGRRRRGGRAGRRA